MIPTEAAERWPGQLGRFAIPAAAMVACLPAISSAAALLLGAGLALTVGNPHVDTTRRISKLLLPAAVVGLGGAMDLFVVARAGTTGFGYTLASIAACLGAGWLLSRVLRMEGRTGLLITVGTAIWRERHRRRRAGGGCGRSRGFRLAGGGLP